MNPKRPTSVTVIAVLQILFGLLWLGFEGYDLLNAEPPPDPADAGAGLSDQLDKHLTATVPGYKTFGVIDAATGVGLSVLMIVSGLGMLWLWPWARAAGLIYAVLSVICLAGEMVYLLNWTGPAAKAFLEPHLAAAGDEKDAAELLLTASSWGPYGNVALMLYPALVFAVLIRPNVRAAFEGEPGGGEDLDDRPLPAESDDRLGPTRF